eukprot:COSAG02_NODE_8232_length_2648_cov_5.561789_2_plen_75_part_00
MRALRLSIGGAGAGWRLRAASTSPPSCLLTTIHSYREFAGRAPANGGIHRLAVGSRQAPVYTYSIPQSRITRHC